MEDFPLKQAQEIIKKMGAMRRRTEEKKVLHYLYVEHFSIDLKREKNNIFILRLLFLVTHND
jgi:hypothetical protein